jgi:hypothetical protein
MINERANNLFLLMTFFYVLAEDCESTSRQTNVTFPLTEFFFLAINFTPWSFTLVPQEAQHSRCPHQECSWPTGDAAPGKGADSFPPQGWSWPAMNW